MLKLENVIFKDKTTTSPTQEAFTSCANSEYSLMCFKDNKVLICTGGIGSTINIWPNPIGSCLIQVSLSPSTTSLSSSTTLQVSSSADLPSSTTFPLPTSSSTKGTVIWVLSGVVGVVLIAIGPLVYKWCKWRRGQTEKNKYLDGVVYPNLTFYFFHNLLSSSDSDIRGY